MADAHGLVIGIAAYQHRPRLPAAVVRDARDVHRFLVDPARGGHRPANTRLLLDAEATNRALRAELADLAERAGPDATVFLYLSAHGARVAAGPYADHYLLPVDAVARSAATLARTAMSGDEFNRALRALPARRVLVVLDCCHAAGIGSPKTAGPRVAPAAEADRHRADRDQTPATDRDRAIGTDRDQTPEPGLSEKYYEALAAGRGRAVLAAARDDESSFVLPGATNSLFTLHLLAGLDGGVAGNDRFVRVFDLFEYLQPKVTGQAPGQHPVFKAHLEENFPVALRRGGQPDPRAAGGSPAGGPRATDGFRHDVYLSYVDVEPDTTWVWGQLVPRLEGAGLRVAVSGDVETPGVARVVGAERGIRQARRTLVVLSPRYLRDGMAEFENVLAQHLGVTERRYRLIPALMEPLHAEPPARLGMLATVNLAPGPRAEREYTRLLNALAAPLPGEVTH